MPGTNVDSVDVTAQCLCRKHKFTCFIPKTQLPLEASCCHCDSCRHLTGALYSSDTAWHGPIDEVLSSSLRRYKFTGNVDVLFCGTCATALFFHEHYENKPQSLGVFSGALLNHQEPNMVKIMAHIFVGDTRDGGATPWLKYVNADHGPARLWKGRPEKSEELSPEWPAPADIMHSDVSNVPDTVPVHCRCRGIDLVLCCQRDDFRKGKTTDTDTPWFINPETSKHLCTFDACDSCRGAFGIDVVHWTFVLLSQLRFASVDVEAPSQSTLSPDTKSLKAMLLDSNRDPRLGTLALYESSPGVQRYFCSRCSASVFYAVDDRPEMINLAVGLLDAPSGARAESLLEWEFGSPVGNALDVKGGWREQLVSSIRKNAEEWRVKRGYPKSFREAS